MRGRRWSPRAYRFALYLALGAAVWLAGLCGQVVKAADLLSPRMSRLAAEVAAGNGAAVAEFWDELARQGTPLVEPVADDPAHSLVTFVWRGEPELANVVLAGGPATGHPADNQLARLAETDVWYLTRRFRSDLRTTYVLSPNDPLVALDWNDGPAMQARLTRLRPDPLNPRRDFTTSLVELAQAPPQPWVKPRPEVPRGTLAAEKFASQILGNERRITVYRPPGYSAAGEEYPLLIVFDLESYTLQVPLPTMLNNLIHAGRIPPLVALLVGNSAGARGRELTCNDEFVRFLAEELLPHVRRGNHVTRDPARVVIAGSSLGGLAASYFAFRHPELAGNVLAQSPSLGWSPETDVAPGDPAAPGEWLTRQIAHHPPVPVRFYLEAGLLESVRFEARHLRDVLVARGYPPPRYEEYHGGHDYCCWRGSFSDGLEWLLGPGETGPR